jgi:hypothetical protein
MAECDISESSMFTPEIKRGETCIYIIRKNDDIIAYLPDMNDALAALDSFANAHQKELSREYTNAFRTDDEEHHCVRISTQRTGIIYNGSVRHKCTFSCEKVPLAIVVKPRFSINESNIIDLPQPIKKHDTLNSSNSYYGC